VAHLSQVPPISWGGDEAARFLLRASDTGGAFSFYEVSMPAQKSSLLHQHLDADESFSVTEGRFDILVGDQVHHVGPGSLVHGPRGQVHGFRNPGPDTGRMLCIMAPGGIEVFFQQLSSLLAGDPPPDWPALRDLAVAHGIVAHPPSDDPDHLRALGANGALAHRDQEVPTS
jgi:mannose-6-phosphate isomerase-like protein (cupin superfamily)